MNVWRIDTSRENNVYITCEKKKERQKLDPISFEGQRVSDKWDSTVKINLAKEYTQADDSDALMFWASIFVLSEKALNIFKEFAGDVIECLDFECNVGNYVIVNPVDVVDCLDMEKSEYRVCKGAPELIYTYKKLCFRKDALKGKKLFRIHHLHESIMACSDEFKEAIEQAQLKGITFELLSDEIVESDKEESQTKEEKSNLPQILTKEQNVEEATVKDYKYYNNKMLEFIHNGKRLSNDATLESFYEFIDVLIELAKEDARYYKLLTTCYEQVGDFYKAQTCFEKIYNPKDKKALKKYHQLANYRWIVKIRPSERCKNLPHFRYVTASELKNYFVQARQGEKCCVCGKEDMPLYAGYAYEEESRIIFSEDTERFCCECLKSGRAAEEKNIVFNNYLIKGTNGFDEDKKDRILKRTPACSQDFDLNEDVWPDCCGDFCCYYGSDMWESRFKCTKCGKEVVWETFT